MNKSIIFHPLWDEKYRPQLLSDVVGDKEVIEKLQECFDDKYIPSTIFYGPKGTGKTTLSKVIKKYFEDLGVATLYVNSSDDNGIDFIRETVIPFAMGATYGSQAQISKLIILDEFDGSSTELQKSLRNLMETYSSKLSFIFTANYENKILPEIFDRCLLKYKLVPPNKKDIYQRLIHVLHEEGIADENYSKEDIKNIVRKTYPSIRSAIKMLQACKKADGRIVYNEGLGVTSLDYEERLLSAITSKNTKLLREILVEVNSFEPLYKWFFDNVDKYNINGKDLSPIYLTIADRQYKHYFVVDKMINVFALGLEIIDLT